MKILDNIATKIADKVNAKNDEVMLLTQENERLKREYDAKAYTVKQLGNKLARKNEDFEILDRVQKEAFEDLDSKVLENRRLKKELLRIKNNYDELSKKKPDKKLKQRNDELEVMLVTSESLIKANTIYRKTYEFISDEQNRQTIIDNFSHNLSKWISDKNLTDTEVAKKLGTSRNIVGNLRTGKRAVNVNTIQKFDIELCEYFECSVYELVTEKMEKSEDRRSDCDVVK